MHLNIFITNTNAKPKRLHKMRLAVKLLVLHSDNVFHRQPLYKETDKFPKGNDKKGLK